jgi:phage-related tail protein
MFLEYKVVGIKINKDNHVIVSLKYVDEFGDLSVTKQPLESILNECFNKKTKKKYKKLIELNKETYRSLKDNIDNDASVRKYRFKNTLSIKLGDDTNG